MRIPFQARNSHEREALLIKDKTAEERRWRRKAWRYWIAWIDGNRLRWRKITTYMEAQGLTPRELLSYLREAISGQRVTPPLFECMQVLGKDKTIQRLKDALALI